MLSHFEPLVIRRGDDLSQTRFSGYAFNGTDLIIGTKGLDDWSAEKKRSLRIHEDGCYLLAQPSKSGYRIGADYKGYCKIYIYSHLTDWAVSNSFSTLVEFAHSQNWPVTLNEHVFTTHSFQNAFWQQHSTFETSVQEISLLPRTYVIDISEDGSLSTSPTAAPGDAQQHSTYAEALSHFHKTWIGRLGTVIRHPSNALTAELTGGLDSRVVLALLLSLRQHFPTDFSRQLFMLSNPNQAADFQVATSLSNILRLNLNAGAPPGNFGAEYYDPVGRWWDISLGAYTPIYFAPRSSIVGHFTVGGHGGEGHRSYWQIESPHSRLVEYESKFRSPSAFQAMKASFDNTQAILNEQYPNVPRTVAHYREFRDRIHSGLHAQNTVRLQPLSSNSSYRATNLMAEDALERGQFLYDVIGNGAPNLLRQPFDKPQKMPTDEVLREITYGDPFYPFRGRLFGAEHNGTPAPPARANTWERVRTAFDASLASAKQLPLPEGTLDRAQASWEMLASKGKLAHPRQSVEIQHIILAGLIDGSVNKSAL